MRTFVLHLRLALLIVPFAFAVAGYGQNVAATQPKSQPLPAKSPNTTSDTEAVRSAVSQFVLGPADVIHVSVWKNSELSQTVTIGPDGFISLPLVGDVRVTGMTANELATDLKGKLSTYVMNAQVTVSVVEVHSRQVYVTGQVGRPGGYPLVAPISVLQLIAQAGGLNTFANKKQIVILRSSSSGVQRLKFNYNNAVRGESKQNISLQAGDTVIVP